MSSVDSLDRNIPTVVRFNEGAVHDGVGNDGAVGPPPKEKLTRLAEVIQTKYFQPIYAALYRRSEREILAICFGLCFVSAYFEYLDKARLSLVLLYLIPIWIAAWYRGVRTALTVIALSIPFWLTAIVLRNDHRNLPVFVFNRVAFFCAFGLAIAHLRAFSDNLERLAEKRAQALLNEMAERERLEREMLDIIEREQRRIGQELHDGLCQQLTGTAMLSHVHARKLADESEKTSARKIADLVEQSIWLARGVAKGLYPVEGGSDGLMQAFEEFTTTTSDLFGVRCRFECHLPVLIDDTATAAHLFRIAQEAVGNAIKHGRASEIQIALAQTESGLELSVSDNGRGFLGMPQTGGIGLRSMAIRAKLIGGHFDLRPNASGGVEAHCFVPERLEA